MADDYCNECGMNENHCRCPTEQPRLLGQQTQNAPIRRLSVSVGLGKPGELHAAYSIPKYEPDGPFVLYKDHAALLDICEDRIRELEAENTKLREAYEAACGYIDKSPEDPDIYPDQWEAWQVFVSLRDALNDQDG